MASFKKQILLADSPLCCPACGALVADISYVYQTESASSDFYSCSTCSFIFARPVLIPELGNRQMDGVENAELFNSPLLKKIYINYFIRKEINLLRQSLGQGTVRLLDIGCGTGWTTRVYADYGFEVTGLEPSKIRAEYARQKYGIKVVCEYIENAEFDEKFDVVVLRHIIEHFDEPAAILEKISRFLKPNGVILVVVPNINCLGRYLFETRWEWVLPLHCNFFTPRSIQSFLCSNGFDIVSFYQTASPLYYPGAIAKTFPNRFVKRLMERNRVFSMLLCAPLALAAKWCGKGDNLNVVARSKARIISP